MQFVTSNRFAGGFGGEQDWIKVGLDWVVVSWRKACHISALCFASASLRGPDLCHCIAALILEPMNSGTRMFCVYILHPCGHGVDQGTRPHGTHHESNQSNVVVGSLSLCLEIPCQEVPFQAGSGSSGC